MMDLIDKDGYFVYLLWCEDDSLYCGYTTNIKRRYMMHLNGKGAKYTKAHKVVGLYYYEEFSDASSALKREYAIKQMSRAQKLALKTINQ